MFSFSLLKNRFWEIFRCVQKNGIALLCFVVLLTTGKMGWTPRLKMTLFRWRSEPLGQAWHRIIVLHIYTKQNKTQKNTKKHHKNVSKLRSISENPKALSKLNDDVNLSRKSILTKKNSWMKIFNIFWLYFICWRSSVLNSFSFHYCTFILRKGDNGPK